MDRRRDIWPYRRSRDCQRSLGGITLRQCEWNGANSQKQKQIKRASDKMRFDGGINLFFHVGIVVVRILIC